MKILLRFLVVSLVVLFNQPVFGQECTYSPKKDSFEWEEQEDGIWYATYQVKSQRKGKKQPPVFLHLVKVDLSGGKLSFKALRPMGRSMRLEDIIATFEKQDIDVRAGINGDYYSFEKRKKDPRGMHVTSSEMLRSPQGTSSLFLTDDNQAHMDRIQVKQTISDGKTTVEIDGTSREAERDEVVLYMGSYVTRTQRQAGCMGFKLKTSGKGPLANASALVEVVKAHTARHPFNLKPREMALVLCGPEKKQVKHWKVGTKLTLTTDFDGVDAPVLEAISGGPRVLREGKVVNEVKKEGFSMAMRYYLPRAHPRSAVGISDDGKTLFLLVAEGRIKRSNGLSGTDTACILKQAGASDAMLFDGGGSAALYLKGNFMNVPHKYRNATVRDIANMLAIIKK